MNKDTSPIETGLMPFIRMKKAAEFIGRAALEEELAAPARRSLAFLALEGGEVDPEGDEAVVCLGKAVGWTTSGCWSPLLGRPLAIASIPPLLATPGSSLQVTPPPYSHSRKMCQAFCEQIFFVCFIFISFF